MAKILFVLWTLLASQFASAESRTVNATEYLRQEALYFPKAIIKSCGLKSVGEVPLQKIVNAASSLKWSVFPASIGFATDRDGKMRVWAVYFPEYQTAFVNEATFENIQRSNARKSLIPLMALHESLRHGGIYDENYETTLAIFWTAMTCESKQKQVDFSHILASLGGGVTSTGGGGNDMALLVKITPIIAASQLANEGFITLLAAHPKLRTLPPEVLLNAVFSSIVETGPDSDGKQRLQIEYKNGKKVYMIPQTIFEIGFESEMAKVIDEYVTELLKDL